MNAITYKEIFQLIKENKMWLGNGFSAGTQTLSTESGYIKYDNYDAIEVPFTDAIPSDCYADVGVPISFLDKYNPGAV